MTPKQAIKHRLTSLAAEIEKGTNVPLISNNIRLSGSDEKLVILIVRNEILGFCCIDKKRSCDAGCQTGYE
jgi:hypothetical protein